jgi:adenine-specific DNA-methyltransferase
MILDFFSGSATTAHAVLQLNSEDGGNRRFIMVQLPENLDELLKMADSSAKKDINSTINFLESIDKPHFISELGKYRIDKCGEKIKAELKEKYKEHQQKQQLMIENAEQAPMNPDDLDIGFKVFKLDYSNLKKWSVDVGEDFYKESKETQNAILSEMLGLEVDNFVEGRTELDVVYEIMLKYGLDLTYPIETYNFDGTNVYSIGYGGLIVCLDTNIEAELADKIVELIKELEPSMVRVAVRDLGFVSDAAKTNFKETLKNGVYAYFDGTDDKADKQNQFKFINI